MPNLSSQKLASIEFGKNFMLNHGYIKRDFDINEWAAPEFLEQAAKELLEDEASGPGVMVIALLI